jgi:hypothetical protein
LELKTQAKITISIVSISSFSPYLSFLKIEFGQKKTPAWPVAGPADAGVQEEGDPKLSI